MMILSNEGLEQEFAIGLGMVVCIYDNPREIRVELDPLFQLIDASTLNILINAEIHKETGEKFKFKDLNFADGRVILNFNILNGR